jgi:hypothetical protein
VAANPEHTRATHTPQPTLEQHVAFFRTFGMLKVPGLFAAEIEQISKGFDETFRDNEFKEVGGPYSLHKVADPAYGTARRQITAYFIERNEKLEWIKTDPRITQLAQALLGDGYKYDGSAGNIFNSYIYWHSDWFRNEVAREIHLKFAFYLEELDAQSGALRVMPGTHHLGAYRTDLYDEAREAVPGCLEDVFGMPEQELPYWALASSPGDVVVIDHRILHSNFEGGPNRRMFSLQYNARADS